MRRLESKMLDVGASVMYGVATVFDVVADWLSRHHRDSDKYRF